jgi:hypothetical protein
MTYCKVEILVDRKGNEGAVITVGDHVNMIINARGFLEAVVCQWKTGRLQHCKVRSK